MGTGTPALVVFVIELKPKLAWTSGSLFDRESAALKLGTGGVGGLIAKSATKTAIKKAVQQGVGKGVAVSDDLVKSILGENIVLSTGKFAARKPATAKGGLPFRATTNPLNEAKRRLAMNGVPAKKANDIIDEVGKDYLKLIKNSSEYLKSNCFIG